MSEENLPLEVAEKMRKDLALLENFETKKQITEALKTSFLADRLEANSKQEKLREATLNCLIDKIANDPKIPVITLLKILEIANKGGEVDLASILGGGTKAGGVNLQINNNNNPNTIHADKALIVNPNSDSSSPHKDLGFLLEGIKTIATSIPTDKARVLRDIIKDDDTE